MPSSVYTFNTSVLFPPSLHDALPILTIALVIAIVAVPFINNRMMAIIVTGGAGYLVALMFTIFRAPDLALTQLLVETVSVILFMLVFYHLPKLKKEKIKPSFKIVKDRKSTRLNSSHVAISYAVFCLKKK